MTDTVTEKRWAYIAADGLLLRFSREGESLPAFKRRTKWYLTPYRVVRVTLTFEAP